VLLPVREPAWGPRRPTRQLQHHASDSSVRPGSRQTPEPAGVIARVGAAASPAQSAPDVCSAHSRPISTRRRSDRNASTGAIATSPGMTCRGSVSACSELQRRASGIDDIAGRVIAARGFDATDAVLRSGIRDQVLTTLRAFRKRGTVEQIGLGRGVRWKLAAAESGR
jgi:hypothetical protein